MVSFTKRLRAQNPEKFATCILTAAVLFARFGRHSKNPHSNRYGSRSLQEIWGPRSAKLSVWHSIHILGTIHQSTHLLAVDHFVCIGRGIHLRWNSPALSLGRCSHHLQFGGHINTTTWRYDIFEHKIISYSRRYFGAEHWALRVFHRAHFTGNYFKINFNSRSHIFFEQILNHFHYLVLISGLYNISWESRSSCSSCATTVICSSRSWHSHVIASRFNVVYIAIWIHCSPFFLALTFGYDYWCH